MGYSSATWRGTKALLLAGAGIIFRNGFGAGNDPEILPLTVDPTAGGGVAALQGSFGMRDNGTMYAKTGAGDTAWTALATGAAGATTVIPEYVLIGPTSGQFEDIDGPVPFADANTYGNALIALQGVSLSASHVLTFNIDGVTAGAAHTATFTPAAGDSTQSVALSSSVTTQSGDWITCDLTTNPGTLTSLRARLVT